MQSQPLADITYDSASGFLTDDFLLYAAECRRMASLSCSSQSDATKLAVTVPTWIDLASRIASYGRLRAIHPGSSSQPAYS